MVNYPNLKHRASCFTGNLSALQQAIPLVPKVHSTLFFNRKKRVFILIGYLKEGDFPPIELKTA